MNIMVNARCIYYIFFDKIQENQREFSNFNKCKKKELEKFKNIIENYNSNHSNQ